MRTIRLDVPPDFEHIGDPGYNADRGPAAFYGIRLHREG
jgi:high affinity Mn2+ porin